MQVKARFRVYGVNQCGYYLRGTNNFKFGGLDVTLQQLEKWVEGKSLKETETYQLREGDNIYPTYCRNVLPNSLGEYLVTTWNQSSSDDGTVASIEGDALANKARVSILECPDGNIPGYPSYFWVLPDKNKIITIQIGGNNNGMENLKKYIFNFLLFHSPFCIREECQKSVDLYSFDLNYEIQGYTPDSLTASPDKKVVPRFETYLYERGNKNIQYIRDNLFKVRKLCNKKELHHDVPYEASLLDRVYELVGLKEAPASSYTSRFRYEIDFEKPTEEQFNAIIKEWENRFSSVVVNDWDDIGFRLEGKDRVIWLNKSYASGVFNIAVKKESGMVLPESLWTAISEKRAELLRGLMIS